MAHVVAHKIFRVSRCFILPYRFYSDYIIFLGVVPEIPLTDDSADIVTAVSLERYIRDVVEWHCYKGIALQVYKMKLFFSLN